jgi:hypothetical protein
MISDEELEAIQGRARCVELATSVDDYRQRWREFEKHAVQDVNGLLRENAELRAALQTARGAFADIAHMTDGDVARKKASRIYDDLAKFDPDVSH